MADIVQIRRDVAANWTSANPVLANGEQGFETDTRQTKVGDGATAWTSLNYTAGGGGASTWLGLSDTPGSFSALQLVRANATPNALEFVAQTTLRLDDFGEAEVNTDLDATTVHHGLLPKLGGGTDNYLRADGTWAAPSGGGGVTAHSALTELNYASAGHTGFAANPAVTNLDMNGHDIDYASVVKAAAPTGLYIQDSAGNTYGIFGESFSEKNHFYKQLDMHSKNIESSGDIASGTHNTYNLGTDANRWANVYATNIVTGDLIFEERTCHICGNPLHDAEILSLIVVKTSKKGTHTVPVHSSCIGGDN